jgi:hypothetical protein
MATQKQVAANRANAQKSTGPKTLEGKIKAARNAVRHALSAGYAVLRIESPDELERLTADAVARYQPRDPEEVYAVERIALAKLAVLRAARLEAGMFTHALNDALNDDNCTPYVALHPDLEYHSDIKLEQTRNYSLANGFQRMARASNAWSLYLRYQSQAERLYRRAIEAFDELRKRDLPNEPNFGPQPDPPQSDAPTQNEPNSGPLESEASERPGPRPLAPGPQPGATITTRDAPGSAVRRSTPSPDAGLHHRLPDLPRDRHRSGDRRVQHRRPDPPPQTPRRPRRRSRRLHLARTALRLRLGRESLLLSHVPRLP